MWAKGNAMRYLHRLSLRLIKETLRTFIRSWAEAPKHPCPGPPEDGRIWPSIALVLTTRAAAEISLHRLGKAVQAACKSDRDSHLNTRVAKIVEACGWGGVQKPLFDAIKFLRFLVRPPTQLMASSNGDPAPDSESEAASVKDYLSNFMDGSPSSFCDVVSGARERFDADLARLTAIPRHAIATIALADIMRSMREAPTGKAMGPTPLPNELARIARFSWLPSCTH